MAIPLTTQAVLQQATVALEALKDQTINVLELLKPDSLEEACDRVKIASKLSPILGNMAEFEVVELLNTVDWNGYGKWIRQDPGFPDCFFSGSVAPAPGVEIKMWYPFATELTARFRETLMHFPHDETNVAVIAWLPEHIVWGKPKVLDVWVGSGRSLALARDLHYHNPPDYLVIEPENTANRTINLRQTNTAGYKFQGTHEEFLAAEQEVAGWGEDGKTYQPTVEYQRLVKRLQGRYSYRLDTNFAKIDRIAHTGLEAFKTRVLSYQIQGYSVTQWSRALVRRQGALLSLLGF